MTTNATRGPGPEPRAGTGASTRDRILDAAARLMRTAGLPRTTTKEIAREAGCSEAALYKHFADKEEIFVGVLRERAPSFVDVLAGLRERVGEGDVAAHLEEVVRRGVQFYRESVPMAGALLASPALLAAHRDRLDLRAAGPHVPSRALAVYLEAERERGRLSPDVDADAAAALLVGACFHRAFLEAFFAQDPPPGVLPLASPDEFARQTVRALVTGLH